MLQKYCKQCKLQGHIEATCWVLYPELHKVNPVIEEAVGPKEGDGCEEVEVDVPQLEAHLITIGRHLKK